MATWEGVIATISTAIGAGIVFVPKTVSAVGFPVAILVQVFTVSTSYFSGKLYFDSMQLSAFPCETIYDLAYIVFRKRLALIFVGVFLMFSCSGLILTYFILFGEISAAFVKDLVSTENQDMFYCHRTLYILLLCIPMGPLFYSKTLKELTIVAVILCTVFGLMIGTFGY